MLHLCFIVYNTWTELNPDIFNREVFNAYERGMAGEAHWFLLFGVVARGSLGSGLGRSAI